MPSICCRSSEPKWTRPRRTSAAGWRFRRSGPRSKIADSAGLILRQFGLVGRFAGNWPRAALMAACTSRPAASTSRSRSNCRTIFVLPSWLVDVIWLTPAMRPNMRSSGVATEDAIVSGLAPGRSENTMMTGYSTSGSGATGIWRISHRASQQQRDRQQRSRNRALDEWGRDVHGLVPGLRSWDGSAYG